MIWPQALIIHKALSSLCTVCIIYSILSSLMCMHLHSMCLIWSSFKKRNKKKEKGWLITYILYWSKCKSYYRQKLLLTGTIRCTWLYQSKKNGMLVFAYLPQTYINLSPFINHTLATYPINLSIIDSTF